MTAHRKLIALDFDGVIHSYVTPWTDAATISDPPTPGAMWFLKRLIEDGRFQVVIVSSRLKDPAGLDAVRVWLRNKLWEVLDEPQPGAVFDALTFSVERPPAFLTIDDRAMTFEGTWPDLDAMVAFKPWNKRPTHKPFEEVLAANRRDAERMADLGINTGPLSEETLKHYVAEEEAESKLVDPLEDDQLAVTLETVMAEVNAIPSLVVLGLNEERIEKAIQYAVHGAGGFDTEDERNVAEIGARRAISILMGETGIYDGPSFENVDRLHLARSRRVA